MLAYYSKGFRYIWNEISILITFESNWEKAKEILQRVVDHHAGHLSESAMTSIREAARKTMIMYSTHPHPQGVDQSRRLRSFAHHPLSV